MSVCLAGYLAGCFYSCAFCRFKKEGVRDVVRAILIPWYNTYRIFIQGAQEYNLRHDGKKVFIRDRKLAASSTNAMDIWIRAALQSLIEFVRTEMEVPSLILIPQPF